MKRRGLMRDVSKIQLRGVAAGPSGSRRAIGWIVLLRFGLVFCLAAPSRSATSEAQPVSYPDRIIPVPHPVTSLLRGKIQELMEEDS